MCGFRTVAVAFYRSYLKELPPLKKEGVKNHFVMCKYKI